MSVEVLRGGATATRGHHLPKLDTGPPADLEARMAELRADLDAGIALGAENRKNRLERQIQP